MAFVYRTMSQVFLEKAQLFLPRLALSLRRFLWRRWIMVLSIGKPDQLRLFDISANHMRSNG